MADDIKLVHLRDQAMASISRQRENLVTLHRCSVAEHGFTDKAVIVSVKSMFATIMARLNENPEEFEAIVTNLLGVAIAEIHERG